jgi:hypothetical protein
MERRSLAISRERCIYELSHKETSASFTVSRLTRNVINRPKVRAAAEIMQYL